MPGCVLLNCDGELVDRLLRRVGLRVPDRDLDRLVRGGRARAGGRRRDEHGSGDRCDDERGLLHRCAPRAGSRTGSSLRLYNRAHRRPSTARNPMPKIAFVGAGSVEFTRNLLGDILSFPELAESEIALHDIDPERLETAELLAHRVADDARRDAEGDGLARPPRGARRRRLRDQQHPGRRARGDRARPRDPGPLRRPPDDRRHARHRRHHPHAAHGAGDARHRQRHGRGLPRRLAPQLHEPHGDDLPARLPGHAAAEGRRALPLGAGHDGDDRRPLRRAGRGGHVLRRRHQPPDVPLPPRARRREPLPEARRGDRGATPTCCGACASTCTGGSATSRPSRASTPRSTRPGTCGTTREIERLRIPVGRLRRPQRGGPGGVRARQARARDRRAARDRAQLGVRVADHQLDRDRRAVRDLRQRAQHRA